MFLTALITGTIALIVVSYLTSPEPEDQLNSFTARLQTSSDGPEDSLVDVAASEGSDFRAATKINPAIQKSAEAGPTTAFGELVEFPSRFYVGFLRAYSAHFRGLAFGFMLVVVLIASTCR